MPTPVLRSSLSFVEGPMTLTHEGRKDDSNKLRYDLISPYGLEELAIVYTEGAKKYDDRNWEKGIPWCRIFAAMMRHAWAWMRGSVRHERGMHHLASVAWCAFALIEYEVTHPEFDNRPKGKGEPWQKNPVGFTKTGATS